MKKIIRNIIVSSFLICSPLFMNNIFADQPPNPGGGPGSGDEPVGGGAPIGSGLFVMLSLAATYGSKKVFDARKRL
jgi:hypothetical protein